MSSGKISITFVIPAVAPMVAYLAALGNERAARRLDRPPGE